MHINATQSDKERLAHARYTNSAFRASAPQNKPEHLSWNLRPRNITAEIGGPAFLTSSQHLTSVSKLVNSLTNETGMYFAKQESLPEPSSSHSPYRDQAS